MLLLPPQRALPLWQFRRTIPVLRLSPGGYPLFANGKIAGGIAVGGGTEAQDCEIAEYVVSVFDEEVNRV